MNETKPYTVMMTFVSGCNRSCKFCGTNGIEKKFHYVTADVIRKACQLIKNSSYNPRIFIAGNGEPTLHPDVIGMLKIIREELPNSWIQMATNGFFIKKYGYSFINELLTYLNDLSMDDYDGDFDFNEIYNQIEIYNSKSEKDKCEFAVLKDKVPFYAEKNLKKKRLLLIPNIEEQNIDCRKFNNHCGAGMPAVKTHLEKKCTIVFRSMMIRWDGKVAICCNDFRGQYFVCNIMDKSFTKLEDVWLHERFVSARKVLFHLHRKAIFPCNICNAPAMRVGLIEKPEEPTEKDLEIVHRKFDSCDKIVMRDYEINPPTDYRLF